MILFAVVVIVGSLRIGVDWASDGPRAGFFPFYCALFVLIASIANLYQAIIKPGGALFVEWGQFGRVISVVVPAGVYVALVPTIGMYAASALLIGVFMRWIGKYGWAMVLAISVAVPIATFVVFERWFLVPLPKGPIETFLGF